MAKFANISVLDFDPQINSCIDLLKELRGKEYNSFIARFIGKFIEKRTNKNINKLIDGVLKRYDDEITPLNIQHALYLYNKYCKKLVNRTSSFFDFDEGCNYSCKIESFSMNQNKITVIIDAISDEEFDNDNGSYFKRKKYEYTFDMDNDTIDIVVLTGTTISDDMKEQLNKMTTTISNGGAIWEVIYFTLIKGIKDAVLISIKKEITQKN